MSQKVAKSRNNGLKQRFHDRIINKIVDWVLGNKVDQGEVSAMHWDAQDKRLIGTLIENPKAADINATLNDPKLRRFFMSIRQNGLNTADVEMFYRHRDRLPLKQMNWAYDHEDFEYDFSTNEADSSLSSRHPIHAGFYMLEIQTDTPQFHARIDLQIDVDRRGGDGEDTSVHYLTLTSERICKRLLWLDEDSMVRLSTPGEQALDHLAYLRLSRLTRSFFVSRLMKKLGMRFVFARHRAVKDETLWQWWQQYEQWFVESDDLTQAYRHQVQHVDPRTRPSRARQVFNLSRWLK